MGEKKFVKGSAIKSEGMKQIWHTEAKFVGEEIAFSIEEILDADQKKARVLAPAISAEAVITFVPSIIINKLIQGDIETGKMYISTFNGKVKSKNVNKTTGRKQEYNDFTIYEAVAK